MWTSLLPGGVLPDQPESREIMAVGLPELCADQPFG